MIGKRETMEILHYALERERERERERFFKKRGWKVMPKDMESEDAKRGQKEEWKGGEIGGTFALRDNEIWER